MRLNKAFQAVSSYPLPEVVLIVLTSLLLLKAQTVMFFLRSSRLYDRLQFPSRSTILTLFLKPFASIRPTRLASLVEACDKNLGWKPSCLRRTIVLSAMLRAIHLRPDFKIGVHKEKDSFSAHAWLELDGMRLEMQGEGVSFTPLVPPPALGV